MSKKKSLSANLVRLEEGPAPQGRGHDLREVGYDSTTVHVLQSSVVRPGSLPAYSLSCPGLNNVGSCTLVHLPASHSSRLGSSQLLPAAVRMQRFNFSGFPFFLSSPKGSGTCRGKGDVV